jgi:photosystem II stability/assembly factor-like uncharacterized protein
MKNTHPSIVLCLMASLVLVVPRCESQEVPVYLSVVSTRLFVVGATNPQTGIFTQQPAKDTIWSHVGPNNIRAFGVAVHPGTNGRVMYIAAGNGVHKSDDAGTTWRITTEWEITEVLCVSPDPRDVNTVYCATPYGVYKSSDGCRTWVQKNSGLRGGFSSWVVVDPARSATVYCATEDGAYRSDDGAQTWRRLGLSVTGVRTIVPHPKEPSVLFAGTEDHGLYRSPNGGVWWTKCEAGIDHTTFYSIAIDPLAPDTMYATGYVTGVYKSIDGGKTWKRMNNGLSVLTFHTLACDPTTSGRVYAGAYWGGVFRTDDGGKNWRNVGLPDSQVWTIQFASK